MNQKIQFLRLKIFNNITKKKLQTSIKIKQEKRTIILTTHHLDEAEILADRIGIMSRG